MSIALLGAATGIGLVLAVAFGTMGCIWLTENEGWRRVAGGTMLLVTMATVGGFVAYAFASAAGLVR